jgi:hypothetical protein
MSENELLRQMFGTMIKEAEDDGESFMLGAT